MGVEQRFKPEVVYQEHEKRAASYFQELAELVRTKAYRQTLDKEIERWKKKHLASPVRTFLTNKFSKVHTDDYRSYLNWLDRQGKLERYLDRSISYIYMRDLGKTLDEEDTRKKIAKTVSSLKDQFLTNNKEELFDQVSLYRFAQKEQIETTMIWLFEKLKAVAANLPQELDATGARRKLVKIIAGVVMHVMDEFTDQTAQSERSSKLADAIRLGYAYGLTYPFIDDLLDAKILSANEERGYVELIRQTLLTGIVPELGKWPEENGDLLIYIHAELKEAFEAIQSYQHPDQRRAFLEEAYVFFESQEIDRKKKLKSQTYTNEEIYVPVILKSASSRLMVRTVLSQKANADVQKRTFLYGIYNQLADDFADWASDLADGAVTPFTYYLSYYKKRTDLLNPFELYWTVISYLIQEVYHSDEKTADIILTRAMNGLRRYRERVGDQAYEEFMAIFAQGQSFPIQHVKDVDFFDKLLRDEMIAELNTSNDEQECFRETVEQVRDRINDVLHLPVEKNEPIIEAANYSLAGEGKRLRPIVTWVMGVDGYGLAEESIIPLVKSLEYLHTASLIFDDLPAQDNSPSRRGRATLHRVYNVAVAEITGLFLTQKAIEEQTALKEFEPQTVLELIQYSTQMTEWMCQGQAMDLEARGKTLSRNELEQMCFYKTGLGFEASLMMPAILAKVEQGERSALKTFAKHAGMVFQIKDDLLDTEGNQASLGKPVGLDTNNYASTFVTVLGVDVAKRAMWEHYCLAHEALQQIPRELPFLKQVLAYFIHRDH